MIKENIKRDIGSLIGENLESMQYSMEQYGGIYLAKVDMLATDEVISLEVELDEGSIAFTYPVAESEAQEVFEYLQYAIEEQDIKVFTLYAEFEAALNRDNF